MKKINVQDYKTIAADFLELVVAGRIDEAFVKHVEMEGVHHNVYFQAGFPNLKQAMIDNHKQFPVKQFKVAHVLGEDDLVAVHSRIVLQEGEPGMTVVHLFRFDEGKIVEMWDIGQEIPHDTPNQDGAI